MNLRIYRVTIHHVPNVEHNSEIEIDQIRIPIKLIHENTFLNFLYAPIKHEPIYSMKHLTR